MKEPILVILAAGMGSRYGGLKQIDPIGPNGEWIIDYSIYDAVKAGFKKVLLVIKPELEKDLEETLAKRIRPFVDVSYAYQELDDLPDGFNPPEGRIKPWGTAHALISARNQVDAPFAVINADDYYGPASYKLVYDFLSGPAQNGEHFVLVSYPIEHTVTEHGSVARGVCKVSEDGNLKSIRERLNISMTPEGIFDTEDSGERVHIPAGTPVSMNLWGLTADYMKWTWERFPKFLNTLAVENPMKSEYQLPTTIFDIMEEGLADVQVMVSPEKWYGVTYREDRPMVMDSLAHMHGKGVYPSPLWG